jgi:chromosome segregation ATPase|tara:strand:- start:268 stop:999 length:732 start_codon:yes stop_codon:yes gene_type:complete
MGSNDPRNKDNTFDSLPTMKPARDEVIQRRRSVRGHSVSAPKPGLTWVAIVIALISSASCYYLYTANLLAQERVLAAELRLTSLESRLTSAGDEMNQSDAAVRVQLKELDQEVRKLWDNVWKKSKKTLDTHSLNIKNLTTRTGKLGDQQTLSKKQLSALSGEIMGYSAALEELSDDFERLQVESKQLALMGSLLPKLNQGLDEHDKRITANEEWVESINSFRRQVNRQLNALSQPINSEPELQ